jgi:phosphate transport system permease protein
VSHPFKKQQTRPGEWIAEWSIRLVASVSIIVIFLIFVFVFKEAATLFTAAEAPTTQSSDATSSEPADMQPETYGAEDADPAVADASTTTEEPDVYNPDIEDPTAASGEPGAPGQFIYKPKNPRYPEIYNPETGLFPADIDDESVPVAEANTTPKTGIYVKLAGDTWQPVGETPKFGILPLITGTLKTTIVAITIGAPLGILAALYVAFFAKRRVREIVKPAIELLAGFPSVVIGFFCLVTVASFIQDVTGAAYRLNAIVGGIGLSLAVIPIVFSIAEDSLSAVPKTLREASLALGSTEWQTAYRVMLPAAAPGVFAAVLLGIGRAFGETMIAIMATGNAPLSSLSPFEPARTVAATIGSEMGEVVWGSEHYGVLFFMGVLLFVFSFGLNAVTELYVKKRLIKKFQGR